MTIEIIGPDFDGYAMKADGTTIMECLSESELKHLTIGEIAGLVEELYERNPLPSRRQQEKQKEGKGHA